MKTFNIVCLVFWIFDLLLAIVALIADLEVTPIMVICPTIICVMHYICEIRKEG